MSVAADRVDDVLWDDVPDPTYTVSELAEVLRGVLDRAFPDLVWVRGEIHNLSRPASGHVYFTLVEGAEGRPVASLPVMLSARIKPQINDLLVRTGGAVRITDGTEVRICGRLDFFEPRGQLQLRMAGIDPEYTLGRLEADRERLLRVLAAEGLLRRNAQRPAPALPLVIGLVTSAQSAAEADFLAELDRSGYAFRVVRVDARVQGSGAPAAIAAALHTLAMREVDVIALVRGGGARTDLAAFDHEAVARAICAMPVPVHTGIGHETDRSVADEVAHTWHKTPTACAQAFVHTVRAFADDLDRRWADIASCARAALDREHVRIQRHGRHAGVAVHGALRLADHRIEVWGGRATGATRTRLRAAQASVDTLAARLERRPARVLDAAARELDGVDARVRALDPARVLARGWSVTRRDYGTVVRSVDDVASGSRLRTTVGDGAIDSTVGSVDPGGSRTVDTR